jgi:hypothetical protein
MPGVPAPAALARAASDPRILLKLLPYVTYRIWQETSWPGKYG